jgi:hypothetical protein
MLYISLLLAGLLFFVGITNNWIWLYAPLGLFLLVTLAGLDRPAKKRAPAAASGPMVRPIVIRKKYVGPPSIYPEHMKMFVVPRWDHHTTYSKAAKGFGKIAVFLDRMLGKAVKGGGRKFLLILFLIMLLIGFSTYQTLEKIGLGWLFTGGLEMIFENVILLPFKVLRSIIGG